jgi:hypothetical protein
MNPYGTWEVTTEGDCEGKSIRKLGTFTGYFDEIAFALAKKCYYSLDFKRVENTDQFDKTPTGNEVVVRIWDMGDNINAYEQLLKDREVFIKKGGSYKSVTLCKNNPISDEEMEAQRVRNMLLKQGVDVDKIKEFL